MLLLIKACAVVGLITSLIYFLFGYYIQRINRAFVISRLLFFFMFCCSVWISSMSSIIFFSPKAETTFILLKLGYTGVILFPVLFFHLTYTFLGFFRKQFSISFGYGIATALCIINFFSSAIIAAVPNKGFINFKPGILYLLFACYFFVFIGYGIKLLCFVYPLANGYKKQQIKFYIINSAFVLPQILIAFPGVVHARISYVSLMLSVPFMLTLFYSLLKYKLFDIGISVNRENFQKGLFAFVLSGCVFFVIIGAELFFRGAELFNKNVIFMGVLGFILTFLLIKPLDKILSALIERFLFKKYEYQKTLRDAARGMAKITDIDKLFGLIVHFITSRIRIKSVDLFYLNRGDNKYVARLSRGQKRLSAEHSVVARKNSSLVVWMEEKRDILVYDDVIRWLRNERLFPHKTVLRKTLIDIKKKFEDLQAVLCIPCFSKNRLLGFLMLGEKTSGEIYSQDDLDILSTLSHEAAIAIENAQLYEEIYEKMKHIQMLYEKEKKLFVSTAIAFAAAIDAKDKYTHGHAERVTYYCMAIYEEMQLIGHIEFPKDFHENLQIAALLHDVGKIGTPDHILNKKGPLNDLEYEEIKRHPITGASILNPIQELREVTEAIRHHQERYDGTGYPGELKGDQIPLASRIIMVADTFDAMVSDRPYRSRVMSEVAVQEIKQGVGTQFDPYVVEGFLSAYEKKKISLPEDKKDTLDQQSDHIEPDKQQQLQLNFEQATEEDEVNCEIDSTDQNLPEVEDGIS